MLQDFIGNFIFGFHFIDSFSYQPSLSTHAALTPCCSSSEQVLHLWLEVLCSSIAAVEKWYHPWSFLRSPGWVQIKCELRWETILLRFIQTENININDEFMTRAKEFGLMDFPRPAPPGSCRNLPSAFLKIASFPTRKR